MKLWRKSFIFVVMRRLIIGLMCLLFPVAVLGQASQQGPAQAASQAQQYLLDQVQGGVLKGAAVSVCAKDACGKILLEINAQTRLTPASNLKLITTGTALHALGPEFRFQTRLGYTGSIGPDGTLKGDLYLMGGGDPTLGAKDSIAYKADVLFWKWKTLLTQAGIKRIDGRIIGDGRLWEGHLENASWSYDDAGTYYGTGSSALCFYQNAIDYSVKATADGQSVEVTQTYPETPWMHFSNHSVTGPAGSGNSLYLYTTDLAPYAELRGTYSLERRPKVEHFANKFGALTCAYYFWRNLKATGWEVTGGYADISRGGLIRSGADFTEESPAARYPGVIGTTDSPRLADIARMANVRSDNFYAEALCRAMGEAATGIATYDSCRVAVAEVLRGLGLDPSAMKMEDGSGLSRMNQVSAAFMVDFLQAMTGSPAFPAFLASLPHPGEGSLYSIQVAEPERICLKSGSMDGVLCYSGYILDAQGKPLVTLSFLANGLLDRPAEVRAVFTRLLLLLSR